MAVLRGVLCLLAVLVGVTGVAVAGARAGEPPRRVVSMNLCTDQLAMLLAAPGQLVSVSHLAADPGISLMSAETDGLVINHGLAEEIFRLEPDLVVAGTYTTRATVNLLKRLGRRVEEFEPASSFDGIRRNLRRMGVLLARERQAEALLVAFDTELAGLSTVSGDGRMPVLGSYGANSYTTGGGTLENEIVGKTGFRHLGEELGLSGTSRLPLETLVLADPDFILVWERYVTDPSRATDTLRHPALKARFGEGRRLSADSRYWICGTPLTLGAVERLHAALRDAAHVGSSVR